MARRAEWCAALPAAAPPLRSELHAVVTQEAHLVGVLLLSDLLRDLELLAELLEARAAEVERDAQENLARGERGVLARARVGLAVHRARARVGLHASIGTTMVRLTLTLILTL